MRKPRKIPKRKSKRSFTKHAKKVHPKNRGKTAPMRGGIRL